MISELEHDRSILRARARFAVGQIDMPPTGGAVTELGMSTNWTMLKNPPLTLPPDTAFGLSEWIDLID